MIYKISFFLLIFLDYLINVELIILTNFMNNNNSSSDHEVCYCYSTENNKYYARQYSTKTVYPSNVFKIERTNYHIPKCNPVKIWLLTRHGTRLPNTKEIDDLKYLENLRNEIVYNHETEEKPLFWTKQPKNYCFDDSYKLNKKKELCASDYQLIKDWTLYPKVSPTKSSFLAEQGWTELRQIAANYKRIFPSLFNTSYSKQHFHFLHTKTKRTEATYMAFVEGLFGTKSYENISKPILPEKEFLLKPYEYCNITKRNGDYMEYGKSSEFNKFKEMPIYQKMIRDVSERLNLNYTLSSFQITAIWDMCRFDHAWNLDKLSPWCSAFTPKHIKILEYSEDLRYYYKSCHGSKMNSKLACFTAADVLEKLESNVSHPKVIAYFSHSTMVHLFLTALGAVKNADDLLSTNYFEMKRRQYRSSYIPFATNVAIVKYACNETSGVESTKVMFLLNTKPLHFDWCPNGLCDWLQVQRKLKQFTDCENTFCPK